MSRKLSVSGLSVMLALALAAWEIYFFWGSGKQLMGPLDGSVGMFTPDRLGFNMAWLATVYLTIQLVSIPFSLPAKGDKFAGVVDGMASLIPFGVAMVVMFGKPELLVTPERKEVAMLLAVVTFADLFGGYAMNIALSRRMFDFGGAAAT